MLAVVDLFRDQGTVDELGLSAIWDVFAAALFPGTGTVQTRARYFLIVPWVFKTIEQDRVPAAKAPATVRRLEARVIDGLLAGDPNQLGVIGRVSRGQLKRMPSAIYWSGLARWGIRTQSGSPDQVLRSIDRRPGSAGQRDDDGELLEIPVTAWRSDLPPIPADFPSDTMLLDLEPHEAVYLRERIRDACPDSMLDVLLDAGHDVGDVGLPWLHPDIRSFSPGLLGILHHAQRFSEAMHGAALLYNLVLAQQKQVPELVTEYEDRLAEWESLLGSQGSAHSRWDLEGFEGLLRDSGARVHPFALAFVKTWCSLLSSDGFAVSTNAGAVRLVTGRESSLKGPLARIGNRQQLDRWVGHSGDSQYEFRWNSAKVILRDIKAGLEGQEA